MNSKLKLSIFCGLFVTLSNHASAQINDFKETVRKEREQSELLVKNKIRVQNEYAFKIVDGKVTTDSTLLVHYDYNDKGKVLTSVSYSKQNTDTTYLAVVNKNVYDASGRLIKIIIQGQYDGKEYVMLLKYDGAGLLVKDLGATYEYDKKGNLILKTSALGVFYKYEYNDDDQVIKEQLLRDRYEKIANRTEYSYITTKNEIIQIKKWYNNANELRNVTEVAYNKNAHVLRQSTVLADRKITFAGYTYNSDDQIVELYRPWPFVYANQKVNHNIKNLTEHILYTYNPDKSLATQATYQKDKLTNNEILFSFQKYYYTK